MKNFRKVLALILVVATLFSFVAMASAKSASEYTDYADVKYVEAVDVLTALGIINGYDGAFHPADTIDRDEMAKMIAVLRNAGDFDADLYAPANKFADAEGSWAEGYIAYCAQLGIINGLNATTFAPDAAVKVVEVAKMLLCTLGFDAQKQGYVGANWEVAVLRDATKYGIIPADVNPYEAATRDQAAQMFLNALTCDLVAGYVSENIVYVTNSLYAKEYDATKGVELDKISLKEAEKAGWEVAYGNAVVSATPLYSIYGNLELRTEGQEDCYKRPGHAWVLKGAYAAKDVVIGFYADAPKATFTAADEATIAAAIDKYTNANLPMYVDGGSKATSFGNGVLVELYADRIVVINTYIAKVASVSERYGTFKLTDFAGTADLGTYATGDYVVKAGDVVLYWVCDGSNPVHAANNGYLHDLKVIEAVNVDVTASDIYTNDMETVLYASGKEYKYSANLGNNLGAKDVMKATDVAGSANYNLYLDEYGYIMYWAAPAAADTTTYAYYVEASGHCLPNGQNVGATTGWDDAACINTATLVHFGEDGALTPEKKFAVDHDLLNAAAVRSENDITASGKGLGLLFRYTVDADGNMVYTNGDNYANQAKYAPVGAKLSENSWVINAAEGIYCYSGTKFMIRTQNLDGTYTYTQVTGYENLTGTYYAEKVTYFNGEATNIQYFTDAKVGGGKFATYVFIDAKYTDATAKHFLVLGDAPEYERFETVLKKVYANKEYEIYDAIVDGKRALVASDDLNLDEGKMYDSILSYINFDVTLADGTVLELYYSINAKTSNVSSVNFEFVVNEGEVYIAVNDEVYKLADGFIAYTIGAVVNADNETVLDIFESYVTDAEIEGQETILQGYLFTDAKDPASATELYIVTSSFSKLFAN